MKSLRVDTVVIGTGPAGQKAAIQSAKLGKKTVVIEKDYESGGACLNSGTIPSKSLREAILDLTGFFSRSFYGKDYADKKQISINDLNYRLQKVLLDQRKVVEKQFSKNNIDLFRGFAQLESPHVVLVRNDDSEITQRIETGVIIIATGSKPRNPNQVPFDDSVILDSTRLLSIDKVPETMLVLGGGIIGSEYASFFAALGAKVTVIDKRDNMLPLLDKEIGLHLQNGLSQIGLEFLGNKSPKEIKRVGSKAHVTFEDGTSASADVLLYALGRTANVDGLGLEYLGLKLDPYGHVTVNALFQTNISNIYAVGDVIGAPALASTSMEQGRLAARNAYGVKTHHFPTLFPIGIYTIPEISSCGYTEDELQALNFNYEVGRAYYYEIARSHISGSGDGLFKILFHADTLEILGVHIIGRGATEVIHIGQVAMSFNAHMDYFIDQIFNYPTYAEGFRIAALNGVNKVKRFV